MIYCDNDYKLDCENKIQYSQLQIYDKKDKTTPIDLSNYINLDLCNKIFYNIKDIYYIFIVNVNNLENFYVKNAEYCTEIAPSIFKILIKKPVPAKRTYKKRVKEV